MNIPFLSGFKKGKLNIPNKNKCVHVVVTDNWMPDICEITIPNLKQYAKKIGADFNLITTRKFPDYPPAYEKFQIYEDGKDYRWNINIDADTILHKNTEDPTKLLDPRYFGGYNYKTNKKIFGWNKYFERDGRFIYVYTYFTVNSWLTHDVWTPLEIPFKEAKKNIYIKPNFIVEFALSQNISRFGIKQTIPLSDDSKMFTANITSEQLIDAVNVLKSKLKEWDN